MKGPMTTQTLRGLKTLDPSLYTPPAPPPPPPLRVRPPTAGREHSGPATAGCKRGRPTHRDPHQPRSNKEACAAGSPVSTEATPTPARDPNASDSRLT